MFKTLVVLIWPVGIGAIGLLTALAARRWASDRSLATAPLNGHGETLATPRAARSSIVGMLLILTVGALAVYAVTCLLGVLVVHAGPSIDKPVYSWIIHHRVHAWQAVMNRLTKIGQYLDRLGCGRRGGRLPGRLLPPGEMAAPGGA